MLVPAKENLTDLLKFLETVGFSVNLVLAVKFLSEVGRVLLFPLKSEEELLVFELGKDFLALTKLSLLILFEFGRDFLRGLNFVLVSFEIKESELDCKILSVTGFEPVGGLIDKGELAQSEDDKSGISWELV